MAGIVTASAPGFIDSPHGAPEGALHARAATITVASWRVRTKAHASTEPETKPDAMGELLKFKKPKASERHRGKSLCKSGFHKWEALSGTPFDVKRGRLVTRYRCARCGAIRTEVK